MQKNKFLVVEETVNGKATWNQPAGHLEANETLIQAVQRELWEETGLTLLFNTFLNYINGLRQIKPLSYVSFFLLRRKSNLKHSLKIAILIVVTGLVLMKLFIASNYAHHW